MKVNYHDVYRRQTENGSDLKNTVAAFTAQWMLILVGFLIGVSIGVTCY